MVRPPTRSKSPFAVASCVSPCSRIQATTKESFVNNPSRKSAKLIFQLFVFGDSVQRLLIERDRCPGALYSRYSSLDISCISHAMLFDPCINQDEELLSFVFW